MNCSQLLQIIERTNPRSFYLLVGTETFLRRQALQGILDRFIPDAARSFNYSVFSDSLTDVEAALDVARTLPLGNPRRLVLVRGERLNQQGQGQRLRLYLNKPADSTLLVVDVEQLKKGGQLAELAGEFGLQVDCVPLKSYALIGWIQKYAGDRGYRIQKETARFLIARVGGDLQGLSVNMEKLFDWLDRPGRITRDQIEEATGELRHPPLWEFSDAITGGDGPGALALLNQSLNHGESPLVLLAVLARVFKQLISAHEMIEAGRSSAEIGKSLRIPGFKIETFLRLARTISIQWAREMYVYAAELDHRMKSMPTPPRFLLESFVCRATHRRR